MHLQQIETRIFEVRGVKIMLDFHLAELYDVETRVLNQAVKRNADLFPTDFMFEMGKYANLYGKHEANVAFNKREKERFLEICGAWVKTAQTTNYTKIE